MKVPFAAKLFVLPLIFLGCSSLLYYPSRIKYSDPAKLGLQYKELKFESLDKTQLVGWYFPALGKSKGTIIQFHGNAENISSHYYSLVWLTREGFDLFLFDYRGYGGSLGDPTPSGVHKDAIAAVQFVQEGGLGKKPENVILYGQSLGGAILLGAFKELIKTNLRLVVIEGSFMSYQDIAKEVLAKNWFTWLFQPLVYLSISDKYSGKKNVGEISPTPLLVIHGSQDPVIPFNEGKKIFAAARDPKYFLIIPNGSHIDIAYNEHGKYKSILLDKIHQGMKGKFNRNTLAN